MATDEFIINVEGTKILAEVKGNTKSISKSDLGQLITDLGEHLKITGDEIDGILIGNAWRLLPIEDRNTPDKPVFPDNVIKIAERRNVSLLSTTDLFRALCEVLKDLSQKKDTLGKLVGRQGIIDFS